MHVHHVHLTARTAEADTGDSGEQSGVRHPVNSLRLILSPCAPSLTTSSAPSGKVCAADCSGSV